MNSLGIVKTQFVMLFQAPSMVQVLLLLISIFLWTASPVFACSPKQLEDPESYYWYEYKIDLLEGSVPPEVTVIKDEPVFTNRFFKSSPVSFAIQNSTEKMLFLSTQISDLSLLFYSGVSLNLRHFKLVNGGVNVQKILADGNASEGSYKVMKSPYITDQDLFHFSVFEAAKKNGIGRPKDLGVLKERIMNIPYFILRKPEDRLHPSDFLSNFKVKITYRLNPDYIPGRNVPETPDCN